MKQECLKTELALEAYIKIQPSTVEEQHIIYIQYKYNRTSDYIPSAQTVHGHSHQILL